MQKVTNNQSTNQPINHEPISRFPKTERLKSKKLIERLFEEGEAVDALPLKLIWTTVNEETVLPVQAGFTVSKRHFPRAVDRNRIKRLMREAWRLQKDELYALLTGKSLRLAVMFIFTGKQMPEYKTVSEKVTAVIQRLGKSL